MASLPCEMIPGASTARLVLVLPPNATDAVLHVIGAEQFERCKLLEVRAACLGALVLAECWIETKVACPERLVGAVTFTAAPADVATSTRNFLEAKRPAP